MPFTLTEDSQFYDLAMSLINILVIGFCSNSRMVIFPKREKKSYEQQTRKGKYIYDVHMEKG